MMVGDGPEKENYENSFNFDFTLNKKFEAIEAKMANWSFFYWMICTVSNREITKNYKLIFLTKKGRAYALPFSLNHGACRKPPKCPACINRYII